MIEIISNTPDVLLNSCPPGLKVRIIRCIYKTSAIYSIIDAGKNTQS